MPNNFFQQTLFGNTITNWLVALSAGVIVWYVLILLRKALSQRLGDHFAETQTLLDDLIYRVSKRTWTYLRVAAAIYAVSLSLSVGTTLRVTIRTLALILSFIQVALWGTDAINLWVAHRTKTQVDDPSIATKMNAVSLVSKVILWGVMVLMALDNIPNVQVNTLIASLGIGSIAVALAVQNILSDLFASLSIVLDKPFEIGDFINVGDYSGSVEYIGLKSTRLQSLTGEQIVFANSDLLNSRIRNYKRMKRRRVTFTLGISPNTPYELLVSIPPLLRSIIEAQEAASFDRAHFRNYGEFTLDFEVVYYMASTDYTLFMNTQQAINLEIYRQFAEVGIELPYPTQTIVLKRET